MKYIRAYSYQAGDVLVTVEDSEVVELDTERETISVTDVDGGRWTFYTGNLFALSIRDVPEGL